MPAPAAARRGARAGEERAPRRARPRPPRPRGGDHRRELARVVDGALGEHDAAGPERDRERRAGHARRGPRLGILDLVERAHGDAVAGERVRRRRDPCRALQPGLVNRASRTSSPSNQPSSGLVAPSAGPSSSTSSAPRGARAAAAREHDDRGRAAAAVATSGIPGPRRARAARRRRPPAPRSARPRRARAGRRAPKQPQGAPSLPCASATTWNRRKPASTSPAA